MTDKIIENLLSYDPIGDAEERYGELNHDNNVGFAYTLDMLHSRSDLLKREMRARGDTHDRMAPDEYLKIAINAGFNIILEEDFKDGDGEDNKFFVLWHHDGLLLKLDTFTWYDKHRTINSANLYYNILITTPRDEHPWSKLSSGGYYWSGPITPDDRNCTDIWVGDHYVKQALLYRIEGLRSVGIFLKEWVKSDHVYLVHYMDVDSRKDMNTRLDLLREAKMNKLNYLPKEVGEMLIKAYKY